MLNEKGFFYLEDGSKSTDDKNICKLSLKLKKKEQKRFNDENPIKK
jgi:hypothetical protein